MYRDPRKNIPNIPATESAWTTLAPETLRERKIRSGMSGLRAVASRAMKSGKQHERDARRARARGPSPSRSRPPA